MKKRRNTKQPKYWSASNYNKNINTIRDREDEDRLLQEWWDIKNKDLFHSEDDR